MNNIRKIMRSPFRKIMCLALAWAASATMAATNIWQGGVSSDFNVPNNWSLGVLNSSDVLAFSGPAVVQPTLTANLTAQQILFQAGATNHVLSASGSAVITVANAIPIKGLHTSGTNTVSSEVVLSGGGVKSIQQAGPGTLILSGVLSESTLGTSVKYERVSSAFGRYMILGTNTYSGDTSLIDGTVYISSFGMMGAASSIGKGTNFYLGSSGSSRDASLVYVGSGETSDKTIWIGAGSGARSLSTAGASGGLVLNKDMGLVGTASLVFTLSGDSTGNVCRGRIIDPSATTTTSFTKGGTGSWTLGGSNTYSGVTLISVGSLFVNGNQSGATGVVTVANGGTLGGSGVVGGSTTVSSGGKLSVGASMGLLTFKANLTLANGSAVAFAAVPPIKVEGQLSLVNNWTLKLGSGFKNGGSVTLLTYSTLASSPDLVPTFDTTALGFTPSASLSLTDTGSSIVLNGVKLPPSGVTILSIR